MGSCSAKLPLSDSAAIEIEASSDPTKALLKLQLDYFLYDKRSQQKIDLLTIQHLGKDALKLA